MLKLSYAHRSGSGAYEQRRFEEGRRAFRRRVLPVVRLVLLLVAGPCIVYELWDPSSWHFLAGFLAGCCAACYLWARDDVPEHVRRHAEGAEGERATAKALRPLERDGWHVVHNLETARGNRDHVLVGPAGVFLIDSKRLGGVVSIEGDAVCVQRVDDPRDHYSVDRIAGRLRTDAARLHDEILSATAVRAWVQAVVVVWARFDEQIVDGRRITFIHGERLAEWLREQPVHLDPASAERVAQHLGAGSSRRTGDIYPLQAGLNVLASMAVSRRAA